jgi:hypothetical protein
VCIYTGEGYSIYIIKIGIVRVMEIDKQLAKIFLATTTCG